VEKTFRLASLALGLHRRGLAAVAGGARFDQLEIGGARRALAAYRAAPPDQAEARLREAEQAVGLISHGEDR
jgi:hypothetical protein